MLIPCCSVIFLVRIVKFWYQGGASLNNISSPFSQYPGRVHVRLILYFSLNT